MPKTVREYRLVLYRTMQDYNDGDYDVTDYYDTLSAARSGAKFARIELSQQGYKVMIESQLVELDDTGEAVDHYGWDRVVG